MQIRIRFKNYNLFKDGIPECQGEEVPNAWVESKNNLNRFEVTTCEIPCAIFQMPFVGALNGNNLGNIKGSQKILLLGTTFFNNIEIIFFILLFC